jgi:ABC-type polysaccharide/polyol phosphate export permease
MHPSLSEPPPLPGADAAADPAAAVPATTLPPPEGVRQGAIADLREIVTDLWRSRELLHQLTVRDLKLRYKQAVMGVAWAMFMPALVLLSGTFLRFVISKLTGTPLDRSSVAAIAVKSLPWSFFVGTLSTATASLTSNTALVTKVYFPREVLPLSAASAHAFDFCVGCGALAVGLALVHPPPSLGALLWAPVLVLTLFVLVAAAALFLSCANLFFRDVKYIVQVVLTFGVFFTPVFFDATMLGPGVRRIVMLNPLSAVLEGLRLSVVQGHNLLTPILAPAGGYAWHPLDLAYSAGFGIVALLASALLFHRSEFVFAEYV